MEHTGREHPWLSELSDALKECQLPGERAHARLSAYSRRDSDQPQNSHISYKESAVLILLYPTASGALYTALIQRPGYGGVHGAQMAFPGGKKENEDLDLEATALREAEEEVGISASKVRILGSLTKLSIPPSGFIVTPFVGCISQTPSFRREPSEVEAILEVPLELFLDEKAIQYQKVRAGKRGVRMTVPAYEWEERIIWGATAMMISELAMLLEERKGSHPS
ncbi:MAG: CoA pyrophosphatase [Flavobacteriales bacterium]